MRDFAWRVTFYGVGLLIGVFIIAPDSKVEKAANQAVAACEEALPRNQTCEWVVSARVKQEEK